MFQHSSTLYHLQCSSTALFHPSCYVSYIFNSTALGSPSHLLHGPWEEALSLHSKCIWSHRAGYLRSASLFRALWRTKRKSRPLLPFTLISLASSLERLVQVNVTKTAEESAAETQLLVEPRPNWATSLLQKISVAAANSCWDVGSDLWLL